MSEPTVTTWAVEGRLPVVAGEQGGELHSQHLRTTTAALSRHGCVLFRDFRPSPEDVRQWATQLGGAYSLSREAPNSGTSSGQAPAIGLHLERAFGAAMPLWLWFHAITPAPEGGDSILCDGAEIASHLSRSASEYLEQEDVLYWWRRSQPRPASESRRRAPIELRDPQGLGRNFRVVNWPSSAPPYDDATVCRPLISNYYSGSRVFGNAILNTIMHNDDGDPPIVDGFHRVRTTDLKPLPRELVSELITVADELTFVVKLQRHDVLCVDNTRVLHGRAAFSGIRHIQVRQVFSAEQIVGPRPTSSSSTA